VEPFHVIVADPPWKFGDKLPGASRGAERNYKTLSIEEICAFVDPNDPMIAPDAVLFLWRVSSMVEEAYRVVRAWGFTPKTEIVWLKQTATGKPWFGMGRITRAAHETCIVATRGRPKVKVRNVRSVQQEDMDSMTFNAAVGRHSEKPAGLYEIVEALYDGPYLELFARRSRECWTAYGDELGDK